MFLIRWVLCCLLLIAFVPNIVILAQSNTYEHESGWLGIELSCDNTTVSIKDSIAFDVKLINIGKEKLTVFSEYSTC